MVQNMFSFKELRDAYTVSSLSPIARVLGRHTALLKWLKNASSAQALLTFPLQHLQNAHLHFTHFIHGFKMAFASPGVSSTFYSQRWCIKQGGSVPLIKKCPQKSLYRLLFTSHKLPLCHMATTRIIKAFGHLQKTNPMDRGAMGLQKS